MRAGGLEDTVRVFSATVGLACFLLVIVAYQPYRDVARGRAAEQALRNFRSVAIRVEYKNS